MFTSRIRGRTRPAFTSGRPPSEPKVQCQRGLLFGDAAGEPARTNFLGPGIPLADVAGALGLELGLDDLEQSLLRSRARSSS